jgi:hypothetical protein
MRPLVVVIENPDEDPTVLVVGNVEVVELSSYPISRYGDECDIVDTGYEEEISELLARIVKRFLPVERAEAEEHLNWMLSEIDRRKAEYAEYASHDAE